MLQSIQTFHFAEHVHKQLEDMASEGIIRPSNSPWCAPAVYTPKNNSEIHICVDFVQLNKVSKKDAYPVPRSTEPCQQTGYFERVPFSSFQ